MKMTILSVGRIGVMLLAGLVIGCSSDQPIDTADQSTPQSATRAFVQVVADRDADAVERLFFVETDSQKQYVAAYVELLKASSRLHDQAVSAFGRDDSRQLVGDWTPGADEIRRIDASTIRIEDDSATVTTSTGDVFRLRRIEGTWRVTPSVQSGDRSLEEAAASLSNLARSMTRVADDIAQGNLRDIEEARRRILDESGLSDSGLSDGA